MNYRSPLFNLIAGTIFGAVVSSMVVAHLFVNRTNQIIGELAKEFHDADDARRQEVNACKEKLEEFATRAAEYLRAVGQRGE